MKILYHHRIRSKDGQYVHIEEMVQALRALGHEVILAGPAAIEKEEFGSDAGAVSLLKRSLPQWLYELLELGYAFIAYLRLRRAVRLHRPDCLYERYNLYMPCGVWLKHKYKVPMLLEVNAPLFEERSKYGGLSLKALARWTEEYTWRGADFVLPVTHVLADRIRQAGIPGSRIMVVPNGVNLGCFNHNLDRKKAKGNLGLQGRLVLGFTGFIRDWHGLDCVIDLIGARRNNNRCHLLIVGDGPARAALEQRCLSCGVKELVTITGVVPRSQVGAYIAAFDVALQPAIVSYASPLKLFEYMAFGCAILAPATPNIEEILTNGKNAVLFSLDDPSSFSEAMERVCSDEALRERLGKAAKATIIEKCLTWENNAKRVVKLFDELRGQRESNRS